ncbi:MAG: hypothetical protein JSR66_24755 [Proteobacteria bacterium]|nr:hypothetical protein [Pseudomonadota bacterium]
MNARRFAIAFRIAASAQAFGMLIQAVLAGMALSNSAMALTAHMFNGATTFLVSALQAGSAVILWRSREIPRWPLIASVVLMAGDLAQMVSGRLHVFALHLPLGVGLFGVLAMLVYWAWSSRPERTAASMSLEHRGGSYA